jgi:signal transduction histidine kinase
MNSQTGKTPVRRSKPISAEQLLRQAAHDLRSPLSAMKILAAKIEVEHQSSFKLLAAAVQRMESILGEMSARVELAVESTKVGELSTAIAEIVEEKSAANPEILFSLAVDNSLGNVDCSLGKLQRIVSNILTNSIEAFDGRVGKKQIAIRISQTQDQLKIAIEDSGRGIAPHVLPRIGKTGFSFGKKDSESGRRGLGLADAVETLTSWGGSLEIRSELGQGTIATISLPTAKA